MKISYRTDCDVLVIGAGGAGIKAAIRKRKGDRS